MTMNMFNEDKITSVTYFYFECKKCRERWFSTFGICPSCKRVVKFKILDDEQAHAHFMEQMFSEQLHYVFLTGREK